ncbi:MAG TPA: dihydroorotase [Gammaproteobacteria bacterium]|jgi:dihydroorotase|nr:dihydroorotase [Gammaproteobacteria bacterium]
MKHTFRTYDNKTIDLEITFNHSFDVNNPNIIALPGLIDPHVHFRTPGMEHKEDWRTAAKAAIAGGYTTVFDMPNTIPPTITVERLREKKALIDSQLKEAGIPLRYQLFFGADKHHLDQIAKVKDEIIGIKVFMGCSTGDLVIDDDESLHAVFEIAAKENLVVAVHAEDEHMLRERKAKFKNIKEYSIHSKIRDTEIARFAVEKAIGLTRKYGTKLYILHVSCTDELALIKQAKSENLPVFAETTPHHLFLDASSYDILAGKAVVNPPLRNVENHAALFTAIHEGVIDTIGSDHAPHTLSEKSKPYGECPSGMPGIETTLPLLLNAYHDNLLTLQEIVNLTANNVMHIFPLQPNQDVTLVDLGKKMQITDANLQTKCGWSAFSGRLLQGWPVFTTVG